MSDAPSKTNPPTPVLNWTRRTGNYGVGHVCRAGNVRVGSVEYGAGVTRGEERKWRISVSLPDLKLAEPTLYATEEAAKARVEKSVRAWFGWAFADTPQDQPEPARHDKGSTP